jgi:TRAP-type C4-dicarboxylate transport system permease small subunit
LAAFVKLLVLSFIVIVIYMSVGVIEMNMTQLSPAMRIPMGYIFMAIPTGLGISFVYIVISLCTTIKNAYRDKFS